MNGLLVVLYSTILLLLKLEPLVLNVYDHNLSDVLAITPLGGLVGLTASDGGVGIVNNVDVLLGKLYE